MFWKKYFFFLSMPLLALLLPACGKTDTDPSIPDGELPSANIGNPSNETAEATPSTGTGESDGTSEGTTPSIGASAPTSEAQGSLPATQGNHPAEDIPDEEQEVGRRGGEMLPIEWIDPAEYANFAKECQDYSPDDEQRGYIKDYALDGNILYVKSFDAGDPLIYCLDLETEDCYPLCSKPECLHNLPTCNAWTISSAYSTSLPGYGGLGTWMNLYQDKLVLYDATNLFYRRLDGTGGEDIGSLMPSSYQGMSGRTIMTHRGYVYTGQGYYTKNGAVLRFIRMPVSGGDLEIIWEHTFPSLKLKDLHGTAFNRYYGLGDKVYFSISSPRTANGKFSTKLYCYDTVKDTASLYWEFSGDLFCEYPCNGKWCYNRNNSFYTWEPATGEEVCLYANTDPQCQDSYGYAYYNGGFCLLEEEEREASDSTDWWEPSYAIWVHFYDWDGNHIAQIAPPPTPAPAKIYARGVIEDYLIYSVICTDSAGTHYYTAVLDTSRLGDPSLEWMFFEHADFIPQ